MANAKRLWPASLGLAALLCCFSTAAFALSWFYEEKAEYEGGPTDAYLRLAPNADGRNSFLYARCEEKKSGGIPAGVIRLWFTAGLGNLAALQNLKVHLTGQDYDDSQLGRTSGPSGDVTIELYFGTKDALWQALSGQAPVSYTIGSQPSVTIPDGGGKDAIGKFLATCKGYAENAPAKANGAAPAAQQKSSGAGTPSFQPRTKAEGSPSGTGGTPPKEAATNPESPPSGGGGAPKEAATKPESTPSGAGGATPKKAATEHQVPAPPSTGGASEKDAFEAASHMNSVDAWNAFLETYPTGFYANLARKKLAKLEGKSGAPSGQEPEAPPQSVNLGPGTTPWRNEDHAVAADAPPVYTAIVQGKGSQLVTYCNAQGRLAARLEQTPDGAYPDFPGTVEKGLAGTRGAFGNADQSSVMFDFTDGNEYPVSANYDKDSGAIALGDSAEGGGIDPSSAIVADLLWQKNLTVSAPPFAASFQLRNSRAAICAMMQQCGATVPACKSKHAGSKAPACGAGHVYYNGRCIAGHVAVPHCGYHRHWVGGLCVRDVVVIGRHHRVVVPVPHIRFRF